MPKIDLAAIPQSNATGYPDPFDREVAGRWWRRLAPAAGLTAFGASHVVLKPGAWSSQRHWHEAEDELLVMVSGEAVLVEDGGTTLLRPGDVVAWAMGVRDGHHLRNDGTSDCSFVVVSGGDRDGGGAYSDIDMTFSGDGYFHRDGTPYPVKRMA
ncbi:MAG: cupin domain-containing protein [Proteobacteria bacterium]|nr:cupin domain-containing protein [Pseudomonadota bacterium]